jgi:predicted DNA-binding protein with PD1-like motif
MQSRLIHEDAGRQTFVLIFEAGDEAIGELNRFARTQRLSAAQFTGIGAFSDVVLGYFDWERKDYRPIPLDEQVEVVALVGDVALDDGEPAVHAHAVVARSDGAAYGGHLLEGHVRPTLEIVLSESPAHLRKRHDPSSGLALIALDLAEPPQGEPNLPRVPEDEANVAGEQARRVVEEDAETPRGATEEGAGLEPQ